MMIRVLKLWIMKNTVTCCECPLCKNSMADIIYFPKSQYYWNGKGKDPNGPMLMCKEYAMESNWYWKEMWEEYYSGRL
jgi:hypothetical protein